jgi:hypothetical protein
MADSATYIAVLEHPPCLPEEGAAHGKNKIPPERVCGIHIA